MKLKRFHERQNDPYKQWKLTDEDWRNRDKFNDYTKAANDAFQKTDTILSPWVLVPGNNKYYARIKVLKEIITWVKQDLSRRGLPFNSNDGDRSDKESNTQQ